MSHRKLGIIAKRAFGSCPVDGDLETLDSYRAELDAIRCLLYFIRLLIRTRLITPTEHWKIALWLDNNQALARPPGYDWQLLNTN